jgi:DNA-binding response OmpR family regulator/tetratricopeptide (TPR) repeat protein
MATRILIIEDNDNLAQMLKKFLAGQGHAVHTVSRGEDALRILTSNTVDLILLDLKLPDMTGFDFIGRLQGMNRSPLPPIMAMSGVYRDEPHRDELRGLGVSRVLEKPFSPSDLQNAIVELLSPSPPAGQSVLQLLVDIWANSRTGTLTFEGAPPIQVMAGQPLSFTTAGRDEFYAHLLQQGKIGLDDLKTLTRLTASRLALTEMGLLTSDDLLEESRLFLTAKLLQGIGSSLSATFTDDLSAEAPLSPLVLPRFLYDTYRQGRIPFDTGRFQSAVANRFPVRTAASSRRCNLLTLAEEEISFMEALDSKRPLLPQLPEAGRSQLLAFLHLLTLLGIIDLAPQPSRDAEQDLPVKHLFNSSSDELEPMAEEMVGFEDLVEELTDAEDLVPAERINAPLSNDEINLEQAVMREHAFLKGKNYYELFGLTRNSFTFDKMKESYFSKTRQYSPEKFMVLSGPSQSLAQEILSTFASAYNTLSNVVSKERYDEMLNADTVMGLDGRQDDKLQAQVQLQSGKVFLEMSEFENAQKALQDAFTLDPRSHEAAAFLAWSIYRNPASRGSKASIDKAKTLLSKSMQLKPNAEAHAYRGAILFDEGREELAEGEFQKALKLNPKEPTARKGVAHLAEKRENDKKGIFKKFFGA